LILINNEQPNSAATESISVFHMDILKRIIYTSRVKRSLLHFAASYNSSKSIELLCGSNELTPYALTKLSPTLAELPKKSESKINPFKAFKSSIVKLLPDKIFGDYKDAYGRTPLFYAKHPSQVALLYKNCFSSLNIMDREGGTALS